MAHTTAKNVYRKLGQKIDGLSMRAPWNETLHSILRELYTPEEAQILIGMPYGMANLDEIARSTGCDRDTLRQLLDGLCSKGLVLDFWLQDEYYYSVSPMVIGIFEFTMMRTGNNLNSKEWARLFHHYLHGDDVFGVANFGEGKATSIMRTLPHEEAIGVNEHVEVLDYEKARCIVEEADRLAIGLCSCRHEKLHIGEKTCDVPLATCSSFGVAADYLVRHSLAKEVSKSEMLETLAQSRESGLVLNSDNVQRNVTFVCHCCKCCCNMLLGINQHGFPNTVVTSSYLPQTEMSECRGCGQCAKHCPVDAIEMVAREASDSRNGKQPRLNTNLCLGCGVCALKCPSEAMRLMPRTQRVIPPATTFERVILQCLERGTLQNQLFPNPKAISHKALRGFVGGFLRLPAVKRALLSEKLRSSFLGSMRQGAEQQGRGWATEV